MIYCLIRQDVNETIAPNVLGVARCLRDLATDLLYDKCDEEAALVASYDNSGGTQNVEANDSIRLGDRLYLLKLEDRPDR